MSSPSKRVRTAFPRFTKTSERKHPNTNRPSVTENPKGDPNVPDHYSHKQLDKDRRSMN